ncbi:MAG: IclR family transcriptional regulator [Pseudomonadota bacterium]
MAEDKAGGVEAVDRALALLDCFDGRERTLSLAELARRSGLYKSTILRLAVSLERGGYMLRDAAGGYRIGPSPSRLAALYRQGFDLGAVLRPALQALARETGETASFYVREGERRVCLYRAEPERAIRHHLTEGTALPLKAGASAEVLRAWSPDAGVDAGLAAVRASGHAVSRGARDPEVAAVAVPLFDEAGALRGALSLSGLVTRFTPEACAAMLAVLEARAAALSAALGAQG